MNNFLKKLCCTLLAVWMLCLTGCALFQNEVIEISDEEAQPYYTLSENFINALFAQDYNTCYAMLAENLHNTMTKAELQQSWEQVLLSYGDPIEVDQRQPYRINGEGTVVAQVAHAHGGCSIQLTFDESNGVAGLWFGVRETPVEYEIAVPEGVVEREIALGNGDQTLRAIVTLPADGQDEMPAVVLVHDSGAYDRNRAIGNCTPFADLAHGLAQRGIASIRYDKRTYAYGSEYSQEEVDAMTVQEEVIDDALLAVQALYELPGIDQEAICVIGHGLGGMLAPRIAVQSGGKVSGIVSLAGTAREYLDVVYDQNLRMTSEASEQNAIKKEYKKAEKLESMKEDKTLFGIPVPYLKDLYAHPVSDSLAELQIPILIMQGKNDFQMTLEDYKSWQQALEGYAGEAQFLLYDDLNHLFAEVKNNKRRGTVAEYLSEQHVSEQVIGDIASWMTKELL